jgi:RNA polymerase sigma-70 factor, ECF subfamily
MQQRSDFAAEFVDQLNQSRSRLFGFIHALVLNFADAEDLYQQVVTLLWQKFNQYELGTDFTAWAIRVADYTVKNFVRRRSRSKVLFNEEIVECLIEERGSVGSPTVTSRSVALEHCLGQLRDTDRRLIEMCYGENEKIVEVAKREGKTSDAIYVAVHRIRRALYNCIQKTIRREIG